VALVVTRKQWRAVAGIAATLIGTVVGAGFASGREIWQFFARFGTAGLFGLVFTVILLGVTTSRVFQIGLRLKTNSYREFLAYLMGPRWLAGGDLFFSLFLMLLVGVMFAGSGAVFAVLRLKRAVGVVLTGLLAVVVLSRGLSGMVKVNLCFIPLLFVFCVIITGATFCPGAVRAGPLPSASEGWLLAALQFTAYNVVLAVPVLLALAQAFPDPVALRLGSWSGSVILGVMAVLIHGALCANFRAVYQSALPLVVLAKQAHVMVFRVYILVLWGEMLTTLLANLYSVGQRLCGRGGWSFQSWTIILCLAGMAISYGGFARLIAIFYPIYGCLSLVLLVRIFWKTA
jgi:uncharacterized membrane protein YkvI